MYHQYFLSESTTKIRFEDLLIFMTGSDRIPPLGFHKKMSIDFYEMTSQKHYPTASTCDMRLWLPRGIENEDFLKELLEEAVEGSHGFGKC